MTRAIFGFVFLAVTLATSVTFAQPHRGEILIALGSNGTHGMSPALAEIEALHNPPFDQFREMRLLETRPFVLGDNAAVQETLPNGRVIRIELLGVTIHGRYRMRVAINQPGRSDYLPLMTIVAAPGDPFFIAGQKFQSGTLVIGVRVGTHGSKLRPAGDSRAARPMPHTTAQPTAH